MRVGLVVAGLALVAVLVTGAVVRVARSDGFTDHLLSTVTLPLLILVVGAVLVVVAARGPRSASVLALALLAVLVVAQASAFAHTLLPGSRVQDFYPVTPTHAYLSANLHGDRYGATGNTMFAPTSDYYELVRRSDTSSPTSAGRTSCTPPTRGPSSR